MKLVAALLGLACLAGTSHAEVSIRIGEPGFYGRIDIGSDYPAPDLVFVEPMLMKRGVLDEPPLYLRVPSAHYRHWGSYCGRYQACGRRVYFVQDGWYERVYMPVYRERYYRDGRWQDHDRHDHGRHRGHGRD